jgi:hypothetical protein
VSERIWHVKYVVYADIPLWMACGWVVTPALNGTHFEPYAVIMEWPCDCPPVLPPEREKEEA